MNLKDVRIGFAVTGSFCTFAKILPSMQKLVDEGAVVQPIFSPVVAREDTRFFQAEEFARQVREITGKTIWTTLNAVEPIGPKKLLDIMLVAPCTGNTLGKLACGIIDTPVVMAVKSHLRNARPVVLAVSTNDGLSGSAENLGMLLNRRHYYFVPFGQDDPITKPNSLVADMSQIPLTCSLALENRQLQPLLLPKGGGEGH